jgi:putative ABC transport system permease protein
LYITHVRAAFIYRYLSFRLRTGDLPLQMEALGRKWSRLFPDSPFNYTFLDDTLGTMYDTELRMDKAARAATVVSLFIVLSGVFGVVSLSLARRIREVGIRKVLGATVLQLIYLFVREYLLLLALAVAMASPLAYLFLNDWLKQYSYRTPLTVWPFLVVGAGMALMISALIAARAYRTANASPVRSLRTE